MVKIKETTIYKSNNISFYNKNYSVRVPDKAGTGVLILKVAIKYKGQKQIKHGQSLRTNMWRKENYNVARKQALWNAFFKFRKQYNDESGDMRFYEFKILKEYIKYISKDNRGENDKFVIDNKKGKIRTYDKTGEQDNEVSIRRVNKPMKKFSLGNTVSFQRQDFAKEIKE